MSTCVLHGHSHSHTDVSTYIQIWKHTCTSHMQKEEASMEHCMIGSHWLCNGSLSSNIFRYRARFSNSSEHSDKHGSVEAHFLVYLQSSGVGRMAVGPWESLFPTYLQVKQLLTQQTGLWTLCRKDKDKLLSGHELILLLNRDRWIQSPQKGSYFVMFINI